MAKKRITKKKVEEIRAAIEKVAKNVKHVTTNASLKEEALSNPALEYIAERLNALACGLPARREAVDVKTFFENVGADKKLLGERKQSKQIRYLRPFLAVTSERVKENLCRCVTELESKRLRDKQASDSEKTIQSVIPKLKKRFDDVEEVRVEQSFTKGSLHIKITIVHANSYSYSPNIFKGAKATTNAVEYLLESYGGPVYDIETLNSPLKVRKYLDDEVKPLLKQFVDYRDVRDVSLITAERIVYSQRAFFKDHFRQKDKYLVEIKLGSGEILRIKTRSIQEFLERNYVDMDVDETEHPELWLRRFLPESFRMANKLMDFDGVLYAQMMDQLLIRAVPPKSSKAVEDKKGKLRHHAELRYADGASQIVKYLANTKVNKEGSKPPELLLFPPRKLQATHQILYAWQTQHIDETGFQDTVIKFGITSFNKHEFLKKGESVIMKKVRARIKSYIESHELTGKNEDANILLLSNACEIQPNSLTAAANLEQLLKDPKFNSYLIRNKTNPSVGPQEIMENKPDGQKGNLFLIEFAKRHMGAEISFDVAATLPTLEEG